MDMTAIKDRLKQLQSTTSTTSNFWKPEPGKTTIRIVPYKFNKDNPFIELFFHYGLGRNKTYMSPISFGRPDPVDEFARKLKSTGNKDEWIQGRKLDPKMRTFAPVIIRGREAEGVKFWGFGKTVYEELLSIIADPDYGDITDALNGRDILVERQTPAEAGNQYGKTTIRVKPNQTPITDDKNLLQNLFDNQVDITDVYQEPTYDELKEALKTYLNPEEDTNDAPVAPAQETTTAAATDTSKVKDVEDAFDQLFNS